MKADSIKMAKVFSGGGDVHYFLPYFQREYAWDKQNWVTLLNDLFVLYEAYLPEKEPEHFMGSLVVINEGTKNGTVPIFRLVDGQQRLITISLIIVAISNIAKKAKSPIYKKARKLLINSEENDMLFYKIFPTPKYEDRKIFLHILDEKELPETSESKILEAYRFIYKEIDEKVKTKAVDLETFFIVLTNCLQVVFIDLDKKERPYEIFESLNAKGKPLSQADLVRNFVAMKLPENHQNDIFDNYWSKIENLLQEKRTVGKSRIGELTAFLRHYLMFRSSSVVNEDHVYERFRDRSENEFKTTDEFENEIKTLCTFSKYYDIFLRPQKEPDDNIRKQLINLSRLDLSTCYPFLFAIFDFKDRQLITREQLTSSLKILENYLVRRFLAGEPSNYLNKIFPTIWKEIDLKIFEESIKLILIQKNYPSDYKIKQSMFFQHFYDKSAQTRDKTCFILEAINQHLSTKKNSGGFTILDSAPTIEHVMPQSLTEEWKNELGVNFEQIYNEFLDVIGNLTIVSSEWNSQLSNSAFFLKKQKLANHALKINNEYFSNCPYSWNEQAIRDRTEWLCKEALEIWYSFGEPQIKTTSPAKPVKLVFLGETFTVQSWRDVATQTCECLIRLVDDFDNIAEKMPVYFSKSKFQLACRQLSNGWWLYLNLSAAGIKALCTNLLDASELTMDTWDVKEE